MPSSKRKTKLGIISLVFVMFLVSISLISAHNEIPTNVGDSWFDRIKSSISEYFHKQEMFTIYGRELSCSTNPDRTFNFVKDEKYYFSEENICGNKDFFVNYYRGERGYDQYLKEIYYYQNQNSAYITDGDGQGAIYAMPYLRCDAGMYWNEKCYIEIYCCSDGVCIRDSECESDEECNKATASISDIFPYFGVCEQEEVTYHQTDVIQCSNGQKTFLKTVSKGSINWCSDMDEINYILPSGGTSGVCYEESEEPMECNTPQKTCWRLPDCDSINMFTTSCENSGYFSSKATCEQNKGILITCWKYLENINECRYVSKFSTKTCLELGQYDTENNCRSDNGLSGNGNGGVGTDSTARQKGMTTTKVKTATTSELISSVCTESSQCEANSSCQSLQSLIGDEVISDIKAKEIADTISNEFSNIAGWGVGIGATAVCTAFTGLFPICGTIGLGLGLSVNSLFDSIAEKDLNEVGLCIIEENAWCNIAEKFALFSITKDKCTDGSIILGVIILFSMILLTRMGFEITEYKILIK